MYSNHTRKPKYISNKLRKYLGLCPNLKRVGYKSIIPDNTEDFLLNDDIKPIINNFSYENRDKFIKDYCNLSKRLKLPINWINNSTMRELNYYLGKLDIHYKYRARLWRIVLRSVSDENEELKHEIIEKINGFVEYALFVREVFKNSKLKQK